MKKTILLLLTCCVTISLSARNEQTIQDLREDYTRIGCNLHSYEYPIAGSKGYQNTPAPKGYKPFYISHYGRHGSRSNWGNKSYVRLQSTLLRADSLGELTSTGAQLMPIVAGVLTNYNNMDGRLTDRGEREHAALAARMYERFPEVFKGKNIHIQSISSQIPRCIISMCAFTNSLTRLNPTIQYNFDTGERMQKYIDCAGDDNVVKSIHDSIQKELISHLDYDSTTVLKKLFRDTVGLNLNVRQLQYDIYEVASISQDFDINCNVFNYLDTTTVYYYIMEKTYYMALYFCNVENVGSRRLYFAQIALNDWMEKADAAISTGEYNVNLRFGHDYPLLCIVNRMGIGGVGEKMKPEEIEDKWISHRNILMASNIQMIFYKKGKKDDILVKVLYNEQEQPIEGLKPVESCYYRWQDVKHKWGRRD